MEQKLLDIRLQMESLISEREAMIAENMHRQAVGNSMAYGEDAFLQNAGFISALISYLRT